MAIVVFLLGLALIGLVLLDSFESAILPRRVTHSYRFSRLYFTSAWQQWRSMALFIAPGKSRQSFLSVFGPLSMLGLIINWVLGLVLGFAMLHWSLDTVIHTPDGPSGFWTHFYWSGVTFFTLGYGDIVPVDTMGRALAVVEAGMGFGFLAVIISYLPVISQAFSAREIAIGLLDARAGSPPTSGQLMLRLGHSGSIATLERFLAEWERWCAELLESHLSFAVLSYYRSQHDNQSWLAALTMILDTCAWSIAEIKGPSLYQAKLTFAMARHAAVDLALVYKTAPRSDEADRLPDGERNRLKLALEKAGYALNEAPAADAQLNEIRTLYEPFLIALSNYFMLPLPPFLPNRTTSDNWQSSAWTPRAPSFENLAALPDDPLGSEPGTHWT